jgi:hypothetical protein
MHKDRDIAGAFMHLTDRLRPLLGPADHGDPTTPVLHRHDNDEEASEKELATFHISSDSGGHRYAVRKADFLGRASGQNPPATARTVHVHPEGDPHGHAT